MQFVHEPGPGCDEEAFIPQNLPAALPDHSLASLLPEPAILGANSSESRAGSTLIPSKRPHTMAETLSIPGSPWKGRMPSKCAFSLFRIPHHLQGFFHIF